MSEYRSDVHFWMDERIEAYVDGDLPPAERRRLESYVRTDEEAAEMVRLARMIRHELAAIETPVCPPDVTSAVLAKARREAQRAWAAATLTPAPNPSAGPAIVLDHLRARFDDVWTRLLRPTLAAASLAALVAAGALIGRTPPAPPPSVSSAEVEKALEEAKWALAFVSDVSRETGQSIRRNVLEERVAAPIQRALGTAFDHEPTS